HYGPMEDELNRGLPSDRLEAEWWLRRRKPDASADGAVMLRVGADGEPVLVTSAVSGAKVAIIAVPEDFQSIKRRDMEMAIRWRMESRAAFEGALAAGLIATDFRRDGGYVMTSASLATMWGRQ